MKAVDRLFSSLILLQYPLRPTLLKHSVMIRGKDSTFRFLRKLHRAGYSHKVYIDDRITPVEEKLLCKVKNNECHVLRRLFPPLAQRSRSLRPRAHDFVLPRKTEINVGVRDF